MLHRLTLVFTVVFAGACTTNATARQERQAAALAACQALPIDSALLIRGPVSRTCEVERPAVTLAGGPSLRLPASFRDAPGARCDSVHVAFVVDTLG